MAEDSGKKRYIKEFLKSIQGGTGLIDDLWIDRKISSPESDTKGSKARSISGREVNSISELIEDDLRNTIKEKSFTFRLLAASKGSGKTTALSYVDEAISNDDDYKKKCVSVKFQLSDVRNISCKENFTVKFYAYILAKTFFEIYSNQEISSSVKEKIPLLLEDLFGDKSSDLIRKISKKFNIHFFPSFLKCFVDARLPLEECFFEVIKEISVTESQFSFVYLIDELDSLEQFTEDLNEARSIFKQLVRRAYTEYRSSIPLFLYVCGTSDNVSEFVEVGSTFASLVERSIVNIHKGTKEEFSQIKLSIEERIQLAYKGYKNFSKAWDEIQELKQDSSSYSSLREFCQDYGSKVLVIHEKYFSEAPEQRFEGDARSITLTLCQSQWSKYLSQKSYKLSECLTTKIIANHAFDCYVELLHNGECVARCFGEAKNYSLLRSHLDTFKEWLKDVKYEPQEGESPRDIAVFIAPSCSLLLLKKLKHNDILFIPNSKESQFEKNEDKAKSQLKLEGHTVKVLLNKDEKSRLITLPGVGDSIAQRIIKARPLNSLEDLSKVKGIGIKLLTQLQDLVLFS